MTRCLYCSLVVSLTCVWPAVHTVHLWCRSRVYDPYLYCSLVVSLTSVWPAVHTVHLWYRSRVYDPLSILFTCGVVHECMTRCPYCSLVVSLTTVTNYKFVRLRCSGLVLWCHRWYVVDDGAMFLRCPSFLYKRQNIRIWVYE